MIITWSPENSDKKDSGNNRSAAPEVTTCTIRMPNGKDRKLDISDELEIAPGYFPKQDDIVHFTYDRETLTLTELEFLTRPDLMSTGTVVSWEDGKCVLTDIDEDADDPEDDSGDDESDNDVDPDDNDDDEDDGDDDDDAEKDNVTFVIPDDVDILPGYLPQENDEVQFKFKRTTDSKNKKKIVYEITYIRFVSAPEDE